MRFGAAIIVEPWLITGPGLVPQNEGRTLAPEGEQQRHCIFDPPEFSFQRNSSEKSLQGHSKREKKVVDFFVNLFPMSAEYTDHSTSDCTLSSTSIKFLAATESMRR